MKKFLTFLSVFIIGIMCFVPSSHNTQTTDLIFCKTVVSSNPQSDISKLNKPKMAIVIDDFGEDRRGVNEMLNIGLPLTCAVMPMLEYSKQDAQLARNAGYEVILHMPMQAYANLPDSWYGPTYIKNNDSNDVAVKKLRDCIADIGGVSGVNVHIGTAVSQNERLMKAILTECKAQGLPFLDSKTIEGTICKKVGDEIGAKVYERDLFLEVNSTPNIEFAKKRLREALQIAKQKGSVIVIGHVGPVGTTQTAMAIAQMRQEIAESGVQVVPLSQI